VEEGALVFLMPYLEGARPGDARKRSLGEDAAFRELPQFSDTFTSVWACRVARGARFQQSVD